MTCIVGLEYDGKVHLGGDRLRGSSDHKAIMDQPKVFLKDNTMAFGYTTSFRFGNLLQHSLTIPRRTEGDSDEAWLYVDFVGAVRACLKEGGYTTVESSVEQGGICLFGYKGKLYHLQSDFSIIRSGYGYDAVGSGMMPALGSLHTSAELNVINPRNRLLCALKAATTFIPTVSEPYDFIEL